jgi:hypothetical protein
MNGCRITPKQLEAYVLPLSRVLGMGEAKIALQLRAQRWRVEDEPNTLITGRPGQGARTLILSYLTQRLGPDKVKSGNEFVYYLGGAHEFVWIDGGTVTDRFLEEVVSTTLDGGTFHTVALVEHLDQLFLRGMEGRLFSMLAASRVTTYATAHTFREEHQHLGENTPGMDRLRLLLGHFRCRYRSENPTELELLQGLRQRLADCGMSVDHDKTLHVLVRKSGCVVGNAMGALVKALTDNDGHLTFDIVTRYDADPLLVC